MKNLTSISNFSFVAEPEIGKKECLGYRDKERLYALCLGRGVGRESNYYFFAEPRTAGILLHYIKPYFRDSCPVSTLEKPFFLAYPHRILPNTKLSSIYLKKLLEKPENPKQLKIDF